MENLVTTVQEISSNNSGLTKRIIPCLDIKNGRTVKGVNFENIRDAGDPIELAIQYAQDGADELVFLDITATNEGRKTFAELVLQIAKHLNIPFTVGGGISSVEDASRLLEAGADKVSVNSSAVKRPELVDELAREFGSQFVVVAIDTRLTIVGGADSAAINVVHTHGGKQPTALQTVPWAVEVYNRGAGEILLTSMNTDGAKTGFDLPITKAVVDAIDIPVIASGGAGTMQHFVDVFEQAGADAGLAASIFHYGEIPVPVLKQYLATQNIPVRL
ncbi:MAG TPA: imidazole glycerol phosphate synthase subunit HisF [Phnomibacter sp.]|nr:imidazole glycerol phosphate synthase subunit HisF [Phnomibacter sp.]